MSGPFYDYFYPSMYSYNKDLIFLLQDRVPTANSQFQPVASWRNRWNGRTSPSPPPCPRDSNRRTSSKTSIGPKRPYRRREVRWRGIWDLFAVSIQFRRWEIVCLLSVSAVKKNVIKMSIDPKRPSTRREVREKIWDIFAVSQIRQWEIACLHSVSAVNRIWTGLKKIFHEISN